MRLHSSQALTLLLLVHSVDKVVGLDLSQCFSDITTNASLTNNLVGLLDSNGYPVSNISDAAAISYSLCTSVCGNTRDFQWLALSQDFSSWLLPYLALISQLPFGAQYRSDDIMSAILTVGSPVLAGYSLFVTLLNSRWINHRFRQLPVKYPNSHFALSIVSSLQQVPLDLHSIDFASLVVLPENDCWWKILSQQMNYTHKWSAASATSIAWVIIAYILSIANSPSNAFTSTQADGGATGSMWLWLVPIVAGWLVLSPKCDFNRLQAAYDRADEHAHTESTNVPAGTSTQRALTITAQDHEVMSPDELLTPPVFNYSRSLPWANTADTMFQVFEAASEKVRNRIPVNKPDEDGVWASDLRSAIHPDNRRGTHEQIRAYCAITAQRSHWVPGVFTRMAFASCVSLALQWGTVGGAIIIEWFTPTTGMGCRSLSYFIYGAVSTIIWMMLLISSILAHYSAAYSNRKPSSARESPPRQEPLSARVSLALWHCLRRMGKLLAITNSGWVITTCILQYSDIYDTCFCNSSMLSRGAAAYITIFETSAQAALAKSAWFGALSLACGSALAFFVIVGLLVDTIPTEPSL
ncbi:hypothetical protein DFJ58DRAFT_893770 [Suillus subalutaceus]|uniref:uncharacterized protein n=1 Tax=Suillus subalutaceus TaxID=48586 RepID=UPI001B861600|nr:uncharacterized protein DFJ58DRAFT_893770 [Suillus subalutaceus]KAG1845520.1 hypothetical protein DFJ58DRAFT_893770 [Suillus subalutaceus]